jgi:hypothetical protein
MLMLCACEIVPVVSPSLISSNLGALHFGDHRIPELRENDAQAEANGGEQAEGANDC